MIDKYNHSFVLEHLHMYPLHMVLNISEPLRVYVYFGDTTLASVIFSCMFIFYIA
jgi:hypothetical protein